MAAFEGPQGSQTLTGGIIWVFGQTAEGAPCHNPIQTFAHELGHILGLVNSTCSNRIMGSSLSASVSVVAEDCASADDYWMTPSEEQAGGTQEPDPGMPTPLILDLDHDGRIHTTGISSPVGFDFTGNGEKEAMTWTFGESEEGFLWVDLNRNNVVDNGGELFGSSTVLPSGSTAQHGFLALAIYDSDIAGGNSDGIISDVDPIWPRLQLWVDRNHDGVSQRDELATLKDHGVIAISLDYATSDMIDGAGNGHFLQGFFATQGQALGFTTRRYQVMHDIFFRFIED